MNVIRPIQKQYYGDDNRWFLGYIINSAPPAGLEGRVKVRIIGVHNPSTNEVPEKDLPWAQVLIPTTEGGSSGIGRIPNLNKGAFVFGIFLDGVASQIPLVLGSLPHTELPTAIQSERRSDLLDTFNYDQKRIQNVSISTILKDDESDAGIPIRRQQSMKFFIDNGYTVMHAAAITGALEIASQFKTYGSGTTTTNTGPTTVGIANWKVDSSVGNRYAGLIKFANSYKPATDWKLYSVQLQYVLFELRTRFNLANSKLLVTDNIKDASQIVNKYYLKQTTQTDQAATRAYDEVMV